jgi:glucose-1-phosphate thymidylyltransferase
MIGIVLAGGSGTRLDPLTRVTSKQLLPVFNKPMIYYPLSTLISCGIHDIVIVTDSRDQDLFHRLLGDGSSFGLHFEYVVQPEPLGIAQAILLAEKHIGQSAIALILGDNIFTGFDFKKIVNAEAHNFKGAQIFGFAVDRPERYGVIELDENQNPISIEEKPLLPKSSYAVPGIYFYDSKAVAYAKDLRPSQRGELEITDVNRRYLETGELRVEILPTQCAWFDAGTFDSLLQTSNYIQAHFKRTNVDLGNLNAM